MSTDELIDALVLDLAPVDRGRADRHFFSKLAFGAGVSLAIMLLLKEPVGALLGRRVLRW